MPAMLLASEESTTEASEPPHFDGPDQIIVIYSVIEAWSRGEAYEFVSDLETPHIAQAMADALRSLQYQVELVPIRTLDDLTAYLSGIDRQSSLVVNLCEALGAASDGEWQVPAQLEQLGFCYLGANAANLNACLDKGYTKALLLQHGIPTAPFQVFETGHEAITVPFPAIVKTLHEDCSVGLNQNSVVNTKDALRRQVRYILDTYRQPALVEMFLDGREFSVSIWNEDAPEVLAIGEVDYTSAPDPSLAFYNFEAKWNETGYATICPAELDARTQHDICEIAVHAYQLLGCRDYVRVDMRGEKRPSICLGGQPQSLSCSRCRFRQGGARQGL